MILSETGDKTSMEANLCTTDNQTSPRDTKSFSKFLDD